jgi:hypothetical protein
LNLRRGPPRYATPASSSSSLGMPIRRAVSVACSIRARARASSPFAARGVKDSRSLELCSGGQRLGAEGAASLRRILEVHECTVVVSSAGSEHAQEARDRPEAEDSAADRDVTSLEGGQQLEEIPAVLGCVAPGESLRQHAHRCEPDAISGDPREPVLGEAPHHADRGSEPVAPARPRCPRAPRACSSTQRGP